MSLEQNCFTQTLFKVIRGFVPIPTEKFTQTVQHRRRRLQRRDPSRKNASQWKRIKVFSARPAPGAQELDLHVCMNFCPQNRMSDAYDLTEQLPVHCARGPAFGGAVCCSAHALPAAPHLSLSSRRRCNWNQRSTRVSSALTRILPPPRARVPGPRV